MLYCILILIYIALLKAQLYSGPDQDENVERREAVRQSFLHAWKGYKTHAWGSDELRPLSNATVNDRFQGWGVTMIDSLTTLWMMDLKEEFYECVKQIEKTDFTKSNGQVLFFETTIRYLGGLIGGYDMSGEKILLKKAVELADSLLLAFNSPSGLPFYRVDFTSKKPDFNNNLVILSEIGSVQLEFTRLSLITGDNKYRDAALKVYDLLNKLNKPEVGLYPVYLNLITGQFQTREITFGALGDSFYEYLLKLYILLGPNSDRNQYLSMFKESMQGLKKLIRKSFDNRLYLGSIGPNGQFQQQMDHLTFFLPGLLTLASRVTGSSDYQALALELLESCYHAYEVTTTHLGPEVITFSQSTDITLRIPSNNLRPELIESLFYAHKMTGDTKYADRAWKIFQAFEKYSKTDSGYAVYIDAQNPDIKSNQADVMESFFLAETLKYLFLCFCERDFIDLDTWVFNTEAHPFRISK